MGSLFIFFLAFCLLIAYAFIENYNKQRNSESKLGCGMFFLVFLIVVVVLMFVSNSVFKGFK
jgi:ABC-type transport system involved in cytochrome c biogenesis permease subunit